MNHFNVFVGKGQVRNYLTEYERDVVRPRVFGKFRDLLGATAQSPAMLFYLDNWQSAAPEGVATTADAQRNRNAVPGAFPAPACRTGAGGCRIPTCATGRCLARRRCRRSSAAGASTRTTRAS